ncbi:MAG: hypothetical protein IKS21_07065 [Oscillospiraceae bacterium]|nr:hypothetical protein [Oscillospiraceae bacterium]
MKKSVLILAAVALVLVLLAAVLLLQLVSRLNPEQGTGEATQSLEEYLRDQWPVFSLRGWNVETGALELDYPLRFSLEQMKKYGAALEELRTLPEGNRDTVAALKAAAYSSVSVTIQTVTIYGVTTDGQIAYTLHPDGTVSACWDSP